MKTSTWIVLLALALALVVTPTLAANSDDDDGMYDDDDNVAVETTEDTYDEEEDDVDESDVVVLTDSNFRSLIFEGNWLVKFYAPWCGHCKALAPVWEEAASALVGTMNVAKVDCTVHSSVCGQYNVRGYPTLKYFRDGMSRDYSGSRSLDGIMDYAKRVTGPVVSTIDAASKPAFMKAKDTKFVLISSGDEDTEEAFETVANRFFENCLFGLVSPGDDSLFPKHKAPALLAIKSDETVSYDGEWDTEAMRTWVSNNRLPLVGELGSSNAGDYTKSDRPVVLLLVNPSKRSTTKSLIKRMRPLAQKYLDHFVFASLDAVMWAGFVEQFGVSTDKLPHVMVWHSQPDLFWNDPDLGTSTKVIDAFLQDVVDGNIEPQGGGNGVVAKIGRTLENLSQVVGPFGVAGIVLAIFASCGLCFYCLLVEEDGPTVPPPSTRYRPSPNHAPNADDDTPAPIADKKND